MDAGERLARVELAVVYIRAAARQERRRCVEVAEAAVAEYESIMSSLRNSEEWGFAMNELSEDSCKKFGQALACLKAIPELIRNKS